MRNYIGKIYYGLGLIGRKQKYMFMLRAWLWHKWSKFRRYLNIFSNEKDGVYE